MRYYPKTPLRRVDFSPSKSYKNGIPLEQKKYVMAPHRVIQLLHNQVPQVLHGLAIPPIEMAEFKIK